MDEHGDYHFKYALSRLCDPSKAEDAVQETFLAALTGGKSFAGRSAEKSWLIGILKNKVCDHYRKASRETSVIGRIKTGHLWALQNRPV